LTEQKDKKKIKVEGKEKEEFGRREK